MLRQTFAFAAAIPLVFSTAAGAQESAPTAEPERAESPERPEGVQTPVEITVRGGESSSRARQRSSQAITVVSLDTAEKRASDLGEVLSRVQGVSVQRSGSLGSDFRLSMNGLYDAQIKVFVDGIPIDLIYAQPLANIPIGLLERVDVYRGVVPVRLGSDALGGALDLVRARRHETGGYASYQVGSFGLHRTTAGARYRTGSGFLVGADAFFDSARNDYPVEIDVADATGRIARRRVKRFHDAYRGYGVEGVVGAVDKAWARKLLVHGFTSRFAKELQHNLIMTVPYGEARYGARLHGGVLEYEHTFARLLDVAVLANYAYRALDFVDKSLWFYDWYGQRLRTRPTPGEIGYAPSDQTLRQHGAFGRATASVHLSPGHDVTVNASISFAARRGESHLASALSTRDPLAANRRLVSTIFGVEHVSRFAPPRDKAPSEAARPSAYRVENTLFAKAYWYAAHSEDPVDGGAFTERRARMHNFGAGDALRVTITKTLLAKASYELTTHLPSADELFGDGVLIQPNLNLEPERSHNANLGPRLELRGAGWGSLVVDLNCFLRDTDRQILLLGYNRSFSYQNVYRARSLGIEGAVQWTSPGRYLVLSASSTYQSLRNASTRGGFAAFNGDRLPNRPWHFASFGAELHFEDSLAERDRIALFYSGRYVHSFHRSWASEGRKDQKQSVPTQLSHGIGLGYGIALSPSEFDVSLEAHNLTDARLYDSFGTQRPGRAYYAKLTARL